MAINKVENDVNQQLRFSQLIKIATPVSREVLLAAVTNPDYFRNLRVSHSNQEFLSYLLQHPVMLGSVTPTDEAIEEFLAQWEKTLYHQEWKANYNKRYGEYFKTDNKKSATCQEPAEVEVDDFQEVYLDNNATTQIRPEIQRILVEYYSGKYAFGNPGSLNAPGYFAADMVISARIRIAKCLSVHPTEIYFTGSGSEANNLAIKGIAFQHLEEKGHIITSKVEHPSVLRVMEYLETLGFQVTYLEVDSSGMVSSDSVKNALRKDTILVSIMAANNEIGTINPLTEIGRICQEHKIPFMVDAIQAFCKIDLKPVEMGITLLSFSGHKIYGPKGIGGLYVAKGTTLTPLVHGGGQEFNLRAGTENVGQIIAFGRAAELAQAEMEAERERMLRLRKFFLAELQRVEPGYVLNGSLENRLANNLSIGFLGVDSAALQKSLSKIGISVSVGSACSSRKVDTSHVLEAIGADTKNYAAIRFSFGLDTTADSLMYLFKYLGEILYKLRNKTE